MPKEKPPKPPSPPLLSGAPDAALSPSKGEKPSGICGLLEASPEEPPKELPSFVCAPSDASAVAPEAASVPASVSASVPVENWDISKSRPLPRPPPKDMLSGLYSSPPRRPLRSMNASSTPSTARYSPHGSPFTLICT